MAEQQTPVEPVVEEERDAFADAFASLSQDEAPAPKPAEAAPAAAAAAPAEAAPAETLVEGEEQTAEEKAAAEATAAEAAPTVNEDDEDDALLRRLARVIKKEPAEAAPAHQPQQPQPPQQQDIPEILTPDEKAFLADYEKDWPDVARAEAIRRKAEYAHLTGYIFQQVMSRVGPVEQMLQQLAEHAQLTQLQATVPDYEADREKVIDWVNKQPTYLQNAYQHVIRSGTVDEVADLVARYRAETGAPAPAAKPATPAPVPVKTKDTELPTATKQAAASLAPVSSKRSAVPQQDDPNDFESAFAKFATL